MQCGGRRRKKEHTLNDGDLGGGGVKAAESGPIVNHEASANHLTAAIDSSGNKRNLKQRRKLILILNGGARMNKTALIADGTIAAHKHVASNSLPKDLYAQHVRNNLLCFLYIFQD